MNLDPEAAGIFAAYTTDDVRQPLVSIYSIIHSFDLGEYDEDWDSDHRGRRLKSTLSIEQVGEKVASLAESAFDALDSGVNHRSYRGLSATLFIKDDPVRALESALLRALVAVDSIDSATFDQRRLMSARAATAIGDLVAAGMDVAGIVEGEDGNSQAAPALHLRLAM